MRQALRYMRRVCVRCAALVLAVCASPAPLAYALDPDLAAGEAQFANCKNCHQIGEGARHMIGPHLDGLFGRRAGSLDAFKYSSAMKDKGEDGLIWDEASLDAYLHKPQAMVPGTRMSFRGMEDAAARKNLIAWLKQATVARPGAPQEAAAVVGGPATEIAAAALALAGDAEYGEYLAAECVTCHQQSGRADGIPSIVGWPRENFIRALFEYKTNVRKHQVMQLMTTRLGNEEIAALAAYFGSLDPQ